MFGREPVLPVDSSLNLEEGENITVNEYVQNLKFIIKEASDLVKSSLEEKKSVQKTNYDKLHHNDSLKVGELVWLRNSQKKPGKSKKFEKKWTGPYKIEKALSNLNYKIAHLHNDKDTRNVSIQRLKRANLSEIEIEEDEYEIAEILDHKKLKSGIKYLVRFTGWSDKYNQWILDKDMNSQTISVIIKLPLNLI